MQVKHKIATIAILNILSFIFISNNHVSALTYSDNVNMQFTFNPTLSVSVSGDLTIDNLTPGNYSDSNIITITTSTNNMTGYTLYANVGNSTYNYTDLKNGNNTFTNLSTNKSSLSNFDTNSNTWGYSYSVDNGTTWISGDYDSNNNNPDTGYNGLPLYSTGSGIKLVSTTDQTDTSTIKFKIGARSTNTQAAGEYTNTINFYATAHNTPTTFYEAFASAGKTQHNGYYKMQDMTTSICNAVDDSQTTTLLDIRDNNTYDITKINGHCWMTQNLHTAADTKIASASSNVIDTYTISDIDFITGGNSFTEGRIQSEIDSNGIPIAWYNYCVASAGTVCGETKTDAQYDICPSNWHLPTYSEFEEILDQEDKFNPTITGRYTHNTYANFNVGYWWSSTAYSSTQTYYLSYTQTDGFDLENVVAWGNPRYNGYAIRCLAK